MELGLFIDRVYWSLVKKTNIKNNKKTYRFELIEVPEDLQF